VLGVGGVVCLALGAVMLVDVSDASLRVDPTLAVGSAVTAGAIVVFLGWLALRAARTPTVTGMEGLVGEEGEVVVELAPAAGAAARGVLERDGARAAARGARVRCVQGRGLLARGGGGEGRRARRRERRDRWLIFPFRGTRS